MNTDGPNDQQLLARYAREGSEAAFEQLVSRHVGLVYSAALRQTGGDAHLAHDITQLVFTNLARKAGELSRRMAEPSEAGTAGSEDAAHPVMLAGWLHRDTRYTALEILRKERRRQAREQKAVTMQTLDLDNPPPDWTEIRPLLDESLDQLDPADRDVLLLRFFEQRSLAAVGEALGTGEDAARKRVSRALDKLRHHLATRGITTTVSALTVVFAAHGAETVPLGLAAALAKSALAASGTAAAATTATGLTIMTTTKLVLAATAALLLASGIAVKVHQSRTNANQTATVSAGASVNTPAAQPSSSFQDRVRAATQLPANEDLAVALARLREVVYGSPPASTAHGYPQQRSREDSDLRDALAGLHQQRKAALPLLREALKSTQSQVREQAAYAFGLLGPEAWEAVRDLTVELRVCELNEADYPAAALKQMGPMPEIIPDLVQILKDSSGKTDIAANEARRAIPGLIPTLSDGLPGLVGELFKPLLSDSDLNVRAAAAASLALALGNHAGADVLNVTAEALNSGDTNLLLSAFTTLVGFDTALQPTPYPHGLAATRELAESASAVGNVVQALARVATNAVTPPRMRLQALENLRQLAPDLTETNPGLFEPLLGSQEAHDFRRRVLSSTVPVAEIISGLARFPDVAPDIADTFLRSGQDAQSILPALRQALAVLTSSTQYVAYLAPDRIANAIQQMSPDEPKPLFTIADVRSVFAVLNDVALVTNAEGQKAGSAAAFSSIAENPSRNGLLRTPDQMRALLAAVKTADPSAYDAAVAKVKTIDPHFVVTPAKQP